MTAQIDGDDMRTGWERFGDLVPAISEIEKPVDEDERRRPGWVPLEKVIREPGRERDPTRRRRAQGVTSR
jgi:hypothetical protein